MGADLEVDVAAGWIEDLPYDLDGLAGKLISYHKLEIVWIELVCLLGRNKLEVCRSLVLGHEIELHVAGEAMLAEPELLAAFAVYTLPYASHDGEEYG